MTSCRALLQLCFEKDGGETRMRVPVQQAPWKVVRSFPEASGACLVHLNNVSGGVLAGDHLELTIEAGPGAQALLTTTGATRIYRAKPEVASARQTVAVHVHSEALVEYLPDALIPFGGSRYAQDSMFRLDPGGGLFWWEIVAPGRSGERFAYETLELTSTICSGGAPVVVERALLEPARGALDNPMRFGRFTHMASFYICRSGASAGCWSDLEDRLAEAARGIGDEHIVWGVSALARDGLVVRGLAFETRHLAQGLAVFRRLAMLQLYGVEPVLPRKTF